MVRFLSFILFISYSAYAQLSETISLGYPDVVEIVSNIHTTDNHKYIGTSNIRTSPAGINKKEIGLTRLSPCNEVIWSKNFRLDDTTSNLEHRQILQEHGTNNLFTVGFYIQSSNSRKFLYVQKTNPDGEILFSKSYDFGNQTLSNIYTNYSTKDGIVITAKYSPIGGGASYTTLISIKNNGFLAYAFRQKNTFTGVSAAQVSDDVYFIRSSNVVYLTHRDGTVYWSKIYPELLQSSNFFNALYVQDGYIISVRRNAQYYLVKLDLNGEFLWKTDLKPTGYWPVLYSEDDKYIRTASFSSIDGAFKPVFITYNQDGVLVKEQMLDNISIDAYGIPSVFIRKNNEIDIVYSASTSAQPGFRNVVLSEHILASSCLEDIVLPEIENPATELWTPDAIQSIHMPLNQMVDHNVLSTDTLLTDSIRCPSVIIPDSVSTDVTLHCDTGYTYFGTDNNSTYYWPMDGSTDPIRHFNEAGTYEVIIENCHSITHTFITVNDYCLCELFIPTAFTPNGDGLNDSFGGVDNCGTSFYKLEIFDRWGKRLFLSTDISNQWDGTYNQSPVKSDVYLYKIEYTPVTGQSITINVVKRGSVLITY